MKASSIINRVSGTLNDTGHITWSSTELLQYLSSAQRAVVVQRPDAYTVTESLQLAAGTKQLVPAGRERLLELVRNMGADGQTPGRAIGDPVDKGVMDSIDPNWHKRTAKIEVKDWFYDERTPGIYYVYPPVHANTAVFVEAKFSASPADLDSTDDDLVIPDVYEDALYHYTLASAYAKETDSVASQQLASASMAQFNAIFGIKTKVDLTFSPNNLMSELK